MKPNTAVYLAITLVELLSGSLYLLDLLSLKDVSFSEVCISISSDTIKPGLGFEFV